MGKVQTARVQEREAAKDARQLAMQRRQRARTVGKVALDIDALDADAVEIAVCRFVLPLR